MKILVLGSGAREHALVWRLQQDPDVSALVTAPGSSAISGPGHLVPCLAADLTAPDALVELARGQSVDLTIAGPELPLAAGAADRFAEAGLAFLGPTAAAARLETSKAWAKAFMQRHAVPTASFHTARDPEEALEVAREGRLGWPLVVKADGLAGGKGVIIAATRPEAEAAIRDTMVERRFGDAGGQVVLETCLSGPEVSVFALSDGRHARLLLSAQDHKRAYDGDRGPNTGGMGAFAPSPLFTPAVADRVVREILGPVIDGMRDEGHPFAGFLYMGLMLTPEGPRVIEFNVRFGDPEAQVVLPVLDGPLARVLLAAAQGKLDISPSLSWNGQMCAGVVLASGGYPGPFETGAPIEGLDAVAATHNDVVVFHAGTTERAGRTYTAGGRVLTVVGRGSTYRGAVETAYAAAQQIHFDRMHFRTDIGRSAFGAEQGAD